jgi:hypothetical protein
MVEPAAAFQSTGFHGNVRQCMKERLVSSPFTNELEGFQCRPESWQGCPVFGPVGCFLAVDDAIDGQELQGNPLKVDIHRIVVFRAEIRQSVAVVDEIDPGQHATPEGGRISPPYEDPSHGSGRLGQSLVELVLEP